MTTLEFDHPPRPVPRMLRALATLAKRPGRVLALSGPVRVLPAVRIDPVQLGRYNALCGFSDALQVPLTFAQVLAFPLVLDYLVSRDCPWPALGTVHLANRIRQLAPIGAQDVLRIELEPDAVFAHPKGQVFTLEIRVLRDGALVWQATQTLLRRGVSDPVGPPFDLPEAATAPMHRVAAIDVPANIGRRYAAVSGDCNPIHLSALTARMLGFRRAIAHGLWSQARVLALIEPIAAARGATVSTLFMSPLMLPARVSLWCSDETEHMLFELRDEHGERVHFRSHASIENS